MHLGHVQIRLLQHALHVELLLKSTEKPAGSKTQQLELINWGLRSQLHNSETASAALASSLFSSPNPRFYLWPFKLSTISGWDNRKATSSHTDTCSLLSCSASCSMFLCARQGRQGRSRELAFRHWSRLCFFGKLLASMATNCSPFLPLQKYWLWSSFFYYL